MTKIIGVTILKDEDIWIGKAIENLLEFCDDFIILDNGSTDNTKEIIKKIGLDVIHESNLQKTHDYILDYVGKNYWIHGFGGDEIFDPTGLIQVREKILNGYYKNTFQVYPYFLHAIKLNDDYTQATGYLAPPSHPPGKLYNFNLIESWNNNYRNHIFLEKPRILKKNIIEEDKDFHKLSWDKCPYKCLHTRFFKRSTLEQKESIGGKLNPADLLGKNNKKDFGNKPNYNERKKYKIGDLTTVDIKKFNLDKEYLNTVL